MENLTKSGIRYQQAVKRVKQLQGFYIHLTIYIFVNSIIIFWNLYNGKSITDIDLYYTALFWGIGIFVHALTVFVPSFIFGNKWEERKIREIIEKK